MKFTIPHDFTPRTYQTRYMDYFDRGGKRAMWVVHRRGGKDLTAMHQTAKMMFDRRGVYWHIFPTGEQARKAIWEGFRRDGKRIMENVFPKEIRKSPREFLPSGEMIVELKNGSIWRLLGSDKIEVVGAGPVGVVFSEYAVAKPTAWNLIRPMLAENDGWASFITTPRGRNHAFELWNATNGDKAWFRELQTIYDTGALPASLLEEERKSGMPEPLIRQEYLCDWNAALVGSVYGDIIEVLDNEKRVEVEFDFPDDVVFTAWDLGISDATAIWWFRIGEEGVEFLDYYQNHGKGIAHYVDVVASKGFKYAKHWLPHDARARTLVTGSSVLEQMIAALGTKYVAVSPRLKLMDGVHAARWVLQQPGTRFHKDAKLGVDALRQYHYAYDEERKTYSGTPDHDWSSHGADAFRYACLVTKVSKLLRPKAPEKPKPLVVGPANYAFTLDMLWEMNDSIQPRRID